MLKQDLMNFVIVILKEGLASTSPGRPSFGMTTTIELTSVDLPGYIFIVGVTPKENLAGLVLAKPFLV